jgi:drug/metabolite transporter (DMT)-like permease
MAVRLPSLALRVAQPFEALVPALSALLAIPLLDEWPNETDWVAVVLISAGVYLSGKRSTVAGPKFEAKEYFAPALRRSRSGMFGLAFEPI